MWALGIISIVFSAIIFLQIGNANTALQADTDNASKRIALAQNMVIYKSAVDAYMKSNPTSTGQIPDSSLTFPVWYMKMANWTSWSSGGKYAVYAADPIGEVITNELSHITEGSLNAGVKRGGNLWTAGYGNTGITLDSSIPAESPVYIGSIN